MPINFKHRGTALLAIVPLLALQSRDAHAWAIGTPLDEDGCHEPITAEALRRVRATLATAPALTPSRDEAAMIEDVLFAPPSDFETDLAGMTLLIGVREPDLMGVNPLSSLDLVQVHGDPFTQDDHCIRGPEDDDAIGNLAALEACRTRIVDLATAALDGLDASGTVDSTIRIPLKFYVGVRGSITPALPLFYVRIGAALHALEDGFPHTYRTADGMTVAVVLNAVDDANGVHDEPRDGPIHRPELDRCWDDDPIVQRNYELAVQAATELLTAALDPALTREQKIAQFDLVARKYLGFEPGCTFDNNWCDLPEAEVTSSITGCAGCGASGSGTLAWGALALLGLVMLRRRRAAVGAGIALAAVIAFARPASADEPVATNDQPAVQPTESAEPGKEPARDVKTPTVTEVAQIRADKKLGSRWGFTGSVGGAVDRPAVVGTLGVRYRLAETWLVGLDAGWNPWITSSPMEVRSGVATVSGALIRRFPMRFDRVNLRTSLHLGVSTLLFDVYGAPKYSTGPYAAFSPLGIDYDLGKSVRIVWDPVEIALPVPFIGQLPLYYEQFRMMIGLQIGA